MICQRDVKVCVTIIIMVQCVLLLGYLEYASLTTRATIPLSVKDTSHKPTREVEPLGNDEQSASQTPGKSQFKSPDSQSESPLDRLWHVTQEKSHGQRLEKLLLHNNSFRTDLEKQAMGSASNETREVILHTLSPHVLHKQTVTPSPTASDEPQSLPSLNVMQKVWSHLDSTNRQKSHVITRQSKGNLFRYYNIKRPPTHALSLDHNPYFRLHGDYQCAEYGTVRRLNYSQAGLHMEGCLCQRLWHGKYCSIPESVFTSDNRQFTDSVTPRRFLRRIINAMLFNMEYELLEARLHELNDVVDVFLIMESNYSNYGDPKPLRLLKKLRNGYLKEFHSKICYVFLDHFHHGKTRNDGWFAEKHARTYIGEEGMRRILNTAPDDIFVYSDADEIPTRETLQFLKVHDGFPEPVGMLLRWSVFTFFWKQEEPTSLIMACTLGVFRFVYHNSVPDLRSGMEINLDTTSLISLTKTRPFVLDWFIGSKSALAGWHCSWCLPPERIRIKLTSAINADFPRWGDYPDKLRIDYIKNLVFTGTWFDDIKKFDSFVDINSEDMFAPRYILNHRDKYAFFLDLNAIRGYENVAVDASPQSNVTTDDSTAFNISTT